jgi:cytochrome c oxidase subunit 2
MTGMNVTRVLSRGVAALAIVVLVCSGAWAAQPEPWGIGMQPAASEVASDIRILWDIVFAIILAVCLLVLVLLVYIVWRFNAKKNPRPSTTSHNTLLEVAWTAIPAIIVAAIAVPSIKLLYFMDRAQDAEMTLKVTGYQWFWGYEYPDHGGFTFDAVMLASDKLPPGAPRLLETDNRIVIPVNTTVRVLVTSQDVIHAWALPAFGVKVDSVPGRINETWINADKEGVYYGQCSELCGVNHAFMPIAVEVVSKDRFAAWVKEAQQKFARADGSPIKVADSKATN